MKSRPLFLALAGASSGLLLLPQVLLAGLPQPLCVYYGQALDGYGLPYMTNAEVMLVHGTQEVARQPIRGSLSPGVNFALYVHLDDGLSASPYSTRALRSGDLVSIVVRDQYGQHTVMERHTVPPVGQPGELVLVKVTASEDTDGDGLPDLWEDELIAWSEGSLQTLFDVRPGDDFDGDGMTNFKEYRSGTFAFLDYDYLFVEQYATTPNNRLQLTFLSVPGKVYSVRYAGSPGNADWAPCTLAASDTGPFDRVEVEGNGDWLSLYVPIGGPAWFFRLEAR